MVMPKHQKKDYEHRLSEHLVQEIELQGMRIQLK